MSALIIFLLMVAVGVLWQRVSKLEMRMQLFEEFPPRFASPPEASAERPTSSMTAQLTP